MKQQCAFEAILASIACKTRNLPGLCKNLSLFHASVHTNMLPYHINANVQFMTKTVDKSLGKVAQLIIVLSLQVLFLDEHFDALLDVANFWSKSILDEVDSFQNEILVLQFLSALHDTNNSRLNKQLAVVLNCLMCFLNFFAGLGSNVDVKIDLDLLVFEVVVK